MTYRGITLLLVAMIVSGGLYLIFNTDRTEPKADSNAIEITMYRGEACNCCVKWAQYLENQGMEVIDETVDNLQVIKQRENIAPAMQSCHTAIIDGYVVEGHVPADDILRMIAQQPDAIGIAVPGMPAGSPGMEVGHSESYEVLLFDRDKFSVFAEY